MAIEVKVPQLGESITEAVVLEWLVNPGDAVTVDQDLVILETDKISVNVPSPVAGVLEKQVVGPDAEVEIGALLALIAEGAVAAAPAPAAPAPAAAAPTAAAPAPAAPAAAPAVPDGVALMPAVRRLIAENNLDASKISGTGRGGRILKEDVLAFMKGGAPAATPKTAKPSAPVSSPAADAAREEVVPMSRLRRTIARRLVEAQQTAAILTTFNEIDMSAVLALRKQYKQAFLDKYGVKLGFTGFFAKAAIEALKHVPAVNAEIRGDDIVYKNYFNIGVAVGGGKGLVVPVVRDADRLSFAEFEGTLGALAKKARDNKLGLADLTGGTFTISNGGVYGSMMSTPILNPPQSGILGLHKIEQRPVAVDGQVVIRPMMYVALSYDHRIVDGKGAVTFLVKIKQIIEDPNRMLLEV